MTQTQRVRKIHPSRGVGESEGNSSPQLMLLQETVGSPTKHRMGMRYRSQID